MALQVLAFIIIISASIHRSYEVKFIRTIEAIGVPYYKISMTLGSCQKNILYSEYKAWPTVRMNRIMDIYYKSDVEDYKVSSVVIKLVINNTDCLGFSDVGVGQTDFSATLFFANNMAAIFYSLTIYTCHRNFNIIMNKEDVESKLLFYTKMRNVNEN